MDITLSARELDPADLPDLGWSGSDAHLQAIARDLGRAVAGEIVQLVVALPNGRLVGFGAVDLSLAADSGRLWMLSVRESWQSLGVGSYLIQALEQRIVARGRRLATIAVEHDNPRARDLYLRLGYRPYGTALDSWGTAQGQTYVTVTDLLHRELPRAG